jgi:DHHW protein
VSHRRTIRAGLLPALSGLLLLGFVGAIGAGAILLPQHQDSALDGRALTKFRDPTLGSLRNGSWMTSTESWLDDHVPGRERWLELHSELARDGLQQQVLKNVYVGDPHGMLLENVPPLTVPADLATNARALGQEIHALGVKTMSVYVPRREEVFADRLPAAWPRTLATTKPAVEQALSQFGPLLDLTPTLADQAKRDSFFWRTDHHWTPAGALAAIGAISSEAATQGVDIPPDNRPYTTHTYGTFYGSIGREVTAGGTPRPDVFAAPLPSTFRAHVCSGGVCDKPTFVTRLAKAPTKYANRYRAFVGGDYGYQRIENPSRDAHGRILLIKDSFGDALSTYLAERVSTLVTIDERHYSGPEIRAVVRSMQPDLVILMHNQVSMIGNTKFFSQIWVNVPAAVKERDSAGPAAATDG